MNRSVVIMLQVNNSASLLTVRNYRFIDELLHSSLKAHGIAKRNIPLDRMQIVGFRVEASDKTPEIDDGVPVLRANTKATLRLFGHGFTDGTVIGLTTERLDLGDSCRMMIPTGVFKITRERNSSTNGMIEILLPTNSVELFFCAKTDDDVSQHLITCRVCVTHSLRSSRFSITKAATTG